MIDAVLVQVHLIVDPVCSQHFWRSFGPTPEYIVGVDGVSPDSHTDPLSCKVRAFILRQHTLKLLGWSLPKKTVNKKQLYIPRTIAQRTVTIKRLQDAGTGNINHRTPSAY